MSGRVGEVALRSFPRKTKLGLGRARTTCVAPGAAPGQRIRGDTASKMTPRTGATDLGISPGSGQVPPEKVSALANLPSQLGKTATFCELKQVPMRLDDPMTACKTLSTSISHCNFRLISAFISGSFPLAFLLSFPAHFRFHFRLTSASISTFHFRFHFRASCPAPFRFHAPPIPLSFPAHFRFHFRSISAFSSGPFPLSFPAHFRSVSGSFPLPSSLPFPAHFPVRFRFMSASTSAFLSGPFPHEPTHFPFHLSTSDSFPVHFSVHCPF